MRLKSIGYDANIQIAEDGRSQKTSISQWLSSAKPTPDTAKKVATALAKVPQTAVCWRFSGLGVFSRQQILWAGLAETDRFNALAEQVRSCLDDMGQHYDRKPFRAHITLARQWQGPQPQALSSPLANYSFAVSPVCVRLYASERDAIGRICYRVLSSY